MIVQRKVLLEDCRGDERPDVFYPAVLEAGEGICDCLLHLVAHGVGECGGGMAEGRVKVRERREG